MSTFIPNRPLSTRPEAVRSRERRLTEEGFAEKTAAAHKARLNRKKVEDLRRHATGRMLARPVIRYGLEARIRHHLSKGRDAGSIAVREGVLVSLVEEIIQKLHQ